MRRSMRRPWAVALCLLALPLLMAAAPAEAASSAMGDGASTSVSLRDGVVVDGVLGVAYVMNPEGMLDALRLSDGAVLWTSTEAAKPLVAAAGMVVAQRAASAAGELPLLTLDAATGHQVATATLELPGDVRATLQDGPQTRFRAGAVGHAGRVMVTWERSATAGQSEHHGYLPAPEEGMAPGDATNDLGDRRASFASGVASLDPATGTVALADKASARMVRPAGLYPFTGLPEVAGRKFLSLDGQHVLASERTADGGPVERYRWTIYTVAGARLGALAMDRSAAPFVMHGGTLLVEGRPAGMRQGETMVEVPLRVRAIDLASGNELWARAVASTEFTGPFAP